MPKTWSGRDREIEVKPPKPGGIPAAVLAIGLIAIVSLSVTLGTAIYCCTHQYPEAYVIQHAGAAEPDLPMNTPDGH